MALTQSGYPVIEAYGSPELDVRASVYGVQFPGGIRKGAVTTVLLYWAGRWHAEIEPLIAGHCWGYDHRDIRGGSGWSNHAGGCAIDINAPEHPQHTYTLSDKDIVTARRIRDDCDGVIRWGGDWSPSSVDQQHAEINLNLAGTGRVEALAAKIRAGLVPNVPAELRDAPTIHGSDSVPVPSKPKPQPKPAPSAPGGVSAPGVSVRQVQARLNQHGAKLVVDGIWGPKTSAAVADFQRAHNLTVDHWVGPKTWNALNHTAQPYPLHDPQVFGVWDEPGWKARTRSGDPRWDGEGIRGYVRQIQRKVGVTADGIYGPKSRAAVVAWQHKHGLTADGMVGPDTWRAMFA